MKYTAIDLAMGEVIEFAEQDLLDRAEWYIERFVKWGKGFDGRRH